jgi:hypothetical protein
MPRLRKILLHTLAYAAAALAVVYLCDSLYIRHKMSSGDSSSALGAVQYYPATQEKSGQVEIFFESPQNETCVHSLFPHYGYNPCWYAKRRTVRLMGRSMNDDQLQQRSAFAEKIRAQRRA